MFCCGICTEDSDDVAKSDASKYEKLARKRKKRGILKKTSLAKPSPTKKKASVEKPKKNLKDIISFRRSSSDSYVVLSVNSEEDEEEMEKQWPPIGCVSLSAPQTPDFRPHPGPPDELNIPPPSISIWRLMYPPHNPRPRKKRRPPRPLKKPRPKKKKKRKKYRKIEPCIVKYYDEGLYDIPVKYRPNDDLVDDPYSEFWNRKHLTVVTPLEFPEGCISLSSPRTKDYRSSTSTMSVLETPPPPSCNFKVIPILKVRTPSPPPEPPPPPVRVPKLLEKAPKRPPKFRGKIAPCYLQDIRGEYPGYNPCPPAEKRQSPTSTNVKFINDPNGGTTQSPIIESSLPINFLRKASVQSKTVHYPSISK